MGNRRVLCLALAGCVALPAFGLSITQTEALQKAADFLRLIDPTRASSAITVLRAERVEGHILTRRVARWDLSGGEYSIAVDDDTGKVYDYSNRAAYAKVNGGEALMWPQMGLPFYKDPAAAIARAEEVLASVGWRHGPEVELERLPTPDANGKVRRCFVVVKFCDRPGGYPTYGSGNSVMVSLDSFNAQPVEMQRFVQYTYAPVKVTITAEQAAEIASQSIEMNRSAKVLGPAYLTLSEWSDKFSARGAQMYEDNVLPLGYLVRGSDDAAVVVSADTGEVLSQRHAAMSHVAGPSAKAPPPDPRWKPVSLRPGASDTRRSKRSGPLTFMLVGAGVLVLGGGAYLLVRRHPRRTSS